MKIIFATQNKRKLQEMKELLPDFEVMGAAEAGVIEEVIEDGRTFRENALKKARYTAEKIGKWAIADDSGLCIEALEGDPGVYSARWAGKNSTDEEIIRFTLRKMKGQNNRRAYFQSDLILFSPSGRYEYFSGRVNGSIAHKPRGQKRPGLPYDLIFKPEGSDLTFAEMSDKEKNSLSHRGRAFQKLRQFLEEDLAP